MGIPVAKLVIASKNPGKVREFEAILKLLGIATLVLPPHVPDAPEEGSTLYENARSKARFYAHWVHAPVLADDSGLEVDALGGRPGVLSARYAGRHGDDAANNAKLLGELQGVPDHQRSARFRCTLVLVEPSEGREWSAEGTLEGRIAHRPAGTHGFGYDPLFWLPTFGMTLAQLPPEVKNVVSHRRRAIHQLLRQWRD